MTCFSSVASGSLFPKDAFTLEQRQNGAIIFHIIGVLYMVYALALVCDNFFVPAIEEIRKRVINSDVKL